MDLRLYSELLGFFARFLNDKEAANDLVQESYARVYARGESGMVVHNLRALLYRTGKNLAIDAARRRKAEEAALETLLAISAQTAPSTEQCVAARLQLERVLLRLQRMPRKRREVFVLVRIYGYTHAEAAQHMSLSAQAIEKHMIRAVCDFLSLADADRGVSA